MILLRCPPAPLFDRDDIFAEPERQKEMGKISGCSAQIETAGEGLLAMKQSISAIEVVFNMFRRKPLEELFPLAKEKEIALIAIVTPASALLPGKSLKTLSLRPKTSASFTGKVPCLPREDLLWCFL